MKFFKTLIALVLLSSSDAYSGPTEEGTKAYEEGNYRLAITYFEKALAIDLKTYADQHPAVATSWNNLGLAWDSLGEYQKAIGYYDKALAIDLKIYR